MATQLLFKRTSKGPFSRVNADVVIEVVKLSEVFVTVAVITLQNFQSSFSQGILVFENSKALLNFSACHILTEFKISFKLLRRNF